MAGAALAAPGALDRGFGSSGFVRFANDTRLFGAAVQRDGKLVAVGEAGARAFVVRLTPAGRLDPSFNGGNPVLGGAGTTARAVAIQPDGKILVGGSLLTGQLQAGMLVLRLNPNGSRDRSFSGDGQAAALTAQRGQGLALALRGDGRILVAGSATLPDPLADDFPRLAVARLNSNGSLDTGFGQGGATVRDFGRLSFANAVAVQSNGRIVLAGSVRNDLQITSVLAARLTANGAPDSSFGGNVGTPGLFVRQYALGASYSAAFGLALAPGGKIVLGGSAFDSATGADALAVRLGPNGAPDTSFSGDGAAYVPATRDRDQFNKLTEPFPGASAVTLSGGDVILAGYFDDLGLGRPALWALTGGGALDRRFGSNGQAVTPVDTGDGIFTGLGVAPDGSLYGVGSFRLGFTSPRQGLVGRYGGFPVPLELGVTVRGRHPLRTTLRRGLPATLRCNRACNLSALLRVSYRTARRAGLVGPRAPRRAVTVARAAASLAGVGAKALRLRFTSAAKRELADARRVRATLRATARSGSQRDALSRSVVLRG